MTLEQSDWFAIWGKSADPGDPAKLLIYHPLICHLLDVAAVAEVLLRHANWVERLALRLGTMPDALRRMLVFSCALHDIGKCAADFQSKQPLLWPGLTASVFGSLPTSNGDPPPHGDITGHYLYTKRSQGGRV